MENINIKDLNNETLEKIVLNNTYIPVNEKIEMIDTIVVGKNMTISDGVIEIDRVSIKITLLILMANLYTNIDVTGANIEAYDLLKIYHIDDLIPNSEKKEWEDFIERKIQNVSSLNTYKEIFGRFLYVNQDKAEKFLDIMNEFVQNNKIKDLIPSLKNIINK